MLYEETNQANQKNSKKYNQNTSERGREREKEKKPRRTTSILEHMINLK